MLRRVKSLNFSVSGESLPAEATKQKWRLKLRPAMSMTLNTPLASSSLTENTDTMPMLRLWRRKALMASVLPRRMRNVKFLRPYSVLFQFGLYHLECS